KSEPAQVFQHRPDKFHFEARGIQIFVAQNQFTAMCAGALLRHPECPRVAEVQIPRRRRRKASAIWSALHFQTASTKSCKIKPENAFALERSCHGNEFGLTGGLLIVKRCA